MAHYALRSGVGSTCRNRQGWDVEGVAAHSGAACDSVTCVSTPTSAPLAAALDHLAGLVERVTFHNEQNGYCVLRLKVKGERELITLVGHTPAVSPGEYASASGHWVTDREHGRQFRAVFVKISPPTTLTGIERYLGSGMVKGIGPVYAGKLVKAFGISVFDVIETLPGPPA